MQVKHHSDLEAPAFLICDCLAPHSSAGDSLEGEERGADLIWGRTSSSHPHAID